MKERNQGIDLLRAFAVMLVLFHHLDVCGEVPAFPGSILITSLMTGGWVGVDCFFVLSGFLVSGLLFKEHAKSGHIRAGRFLIRRGLKIYPAFYVMILTTVVVFKIGERPYVAVDLLGELLFLQNYLGNLWRHTWSLAVEEHFYLLLVPLLVGVFKLHDRWRAIRLSTYIAVIYVTMAAVCLVLRIERAGYPEFNPQFHQFPTHLRIDSLFLGVLFASLKQDFPEVFERLIHNTRVRIIALLFGVALIMPAFGGDITETPWLWSWGFLWFSMASVCLLGAVLSSTHFSWAPLRWLANMGTYSYSIYLWHMMAGGWIATRVMAYFGGNWWIGSASYFVLSIGAGVVLSKAIEWPVLRLRDRWFPSSARIGN